MVAALTNEAATASVRAKLRDLSPRDTLVSDWVTTEVSSALALKVRKGALSEARRTLALAAYRDFITSSFTVLPVLAHQFQAAARHADRHDLNLRAGDALHLAIAADHGAALLTLDRRLHAACLALGVVVEAV